MENEQEADNQTGGRNKTAGTPHNEVDRLSAIITMTSSDAGTESLKLFKGRVDTGVRKAAELQSPAILLGSLDEQIRLLLPRSRPRGRGRVHTGLIGQSRGCPETGSS
jgi:hypothetical protein